MDALRLILIAACCARNLSGVEKSGYLTYLQNRGIDPSAFHFLARLRSVGFFTFQVSRHYILAHFSESGESEKDLRRTGGSSALSMFSTLMNTGSRMMEGVKELVHWKRYSPLTRVLSRYFRY